MGAGGGEPGPTTVTVNACGVALSYASVAVHVTVVAPIGNVEPGAGTHATSGSGVSSSVAVGSA